MLVACRTSPEATRDVPADAAAPALASASPEMLASATPWNPSAIDWKPFDEGLALAKAQKKHVVLVLSASWCPHCRHYSKVFVDPRLVERSKDFVMIRADADADEEVARRYHPDGGYVPRTFILDADGNIEPAGVAKRARYKHFFDEWRADELLEAMNTVSPR